MKYTLPLSILLTSIAHVTNLLGGATQGAPILSSISPDESKKLQDASKLINEPVPNLTDQRFATDTDLEADNFRDKPQCLGIKKPAPTLSPAPASMPKKSLALTIRGPNKPNDKK